MSAVIGDAASTVSAQVAKRWQAIDPLLPAPVTPPGCGAELTVTGADGQPSAIGTCEHWAGEPGTLDLTWAAARRFLLTAHVAGPDIGPRWISYWPAGASTWPRRRVPTSMTRPSSPGPAGTSTGSGP